jgi:dihydroflavonol-4-reductase
MDLQILSPCLKMAYSQNQICLTLNSIFHTIFSMRALVTGGTGFIGSHLINHLSDEKNAEVFALVRDLENLKWLKGMDIHFLKGDLLSVPSLPTNIDYVFHIAGITKARKLVDYYTVNQHGTASFFQALLANCIRPQKIFFLSSTAAAGPSLDGNPVKEDDEPHPVSAYGESKLLGEKEALRFKEDFPLTILRVGAVYGPRDEDFLPYFKSIKKGILLSQASQQSIYHLCYVKDLIEAFDLCIQKDLESGEIINIADPEHITWDEFGKAIGKILGKKPLTFRCPSFLLKTAAVVLEGASAITNNPSNFNRDKLKAIMQTSWLADITKAQHLLSFFPRFSLEEGLEETLMWYREMDWL